MSTVIDVGCARYGGQFDSVERLIAMYHPTRLYGFDASAEGTRDAAYWLPPAAPGEALAEEYAYLQPSDPNDTLVTLTAKAAWTYDGVVGFFPDGVAGWTGESAPTPVPCFDLAGFIDELPDGPIILKLDCEGAEHWLLEHLILTKLDLRLDRVLVEWHHLADGSGPRRGAKIVQQIACPIEEWNW